MFNDYIPISNVRDYIDHSGVYEIVCTKNGRVYIGQASSIVRRVLQHLNDLTNDRHSNKLLQHDWNQLGHDHFKFKLVTEVPYTNISELMRTERVEIERHRQHGIQLYNDFRVAGAVKPEVEEEIVKEDQLRKHCQNVERAQREYHKLRKKYDNSNREYHRPRPDLSQYEEVTCYDCGSPGGLNLQIFRCDDKMLRCERCIDKYLGDTKGWLREHEPVKRTLDNMVRRYQMESDNYRREIAMCATSFTKRFAARPGVILVSNEFPGKIEKIEKQTGLELERNDTTPAGYVDIPIPSGG